MTFHAVWHASNVRMNWNCISCIFLDRSSPNTLLTMPIAASFPKHSFTNIFSQIFFHKFFFHVFCSYTYYTHHQLSIVWDVFCFAIPQPAKKDAIIVEWEKEKCPLSFCVSNIWRLICISFISNNLLTLLEKAACLVSRCHFISLSFSDSLLSTSLLKTHWGLYTSWALNSVNPRFRNYSLHGRL